MQAKSLREQISWVKVHWAPYRSLVGLIVVLTLFDAAIIVTMPLFLQHVIDGISANVEVRQLLLYVLLLVVFGSAHAAGYYYLVKQRMTANLSLDYSIRMRAFATLCRKGLGFVQKFRTGDIVTR
ncbi:MAG: hypothetical protein HKN21_17120, partial [Candidatus Eisenbacteria bacterium]|nr:hypothetical protein [Candidatus Eisenbacteria bacterium]